MLVYNENINSTLALFKQTVDQAKFFSFDCEMTGVTLSPETDGTKFDTQQARYSKLREVVRAFDLIQLGMTFYIPSVRQVNAEEIYIERTFNFYLFKNSKLRSVNKPLVNSDLTCHPAALKFLNENKFDLNVLVNKGIHYNKLKKEEDIKQLILEEPFLMTSSGFYLSTVNEEDLINVIFQITEFLLTNHEDPNDKHKNKKYKEFTFNSKQTMLYFLGCNLKKILHLSDFTINKDKTKENTIIIEKTKRLISCEEFNKAYKKIKKFQDRIKNHKHLIYQNRFQISCQPNEETINDLIFEELGFSKMYIEYIINKKIPIIGHNIFMDIMFIYDKFIDDLPEDYYKFKQKVHENFPIMYDTKTIAMKLKKYDNTKLENLYKIMSKNKYTTYVNFCADVANGFCLYHDLDNKLLHDAGYDSVITGRCFVLMNKALQNEYQISEMKAIEHCIGEKIITNEKKIEIKKGFIDLSLFDSYKNISEVSLVESLINFDTTIETKEAFIEGELKLIREQFKNVFVLCFRNNCVMNVYEIANLIENDDFDISIVKKGFYSAFIELTSTISNIEEEQEQIKKFLEQIKNDSIENILSIEEYYNNKYKYSISK